jgi:hypothetical protein
MGIINLSKFKFSTYECISVAFKLRAGAVLGKSMYASWYLPFPGGDFSFSVNSLAIWFSEIK